MRPNRIWPILIALGSLAIMWGGGDADVPFPDNSPSYSIQQFSSCANVVPTRPGNPENTRIVSTEADTQSAGIEGEQ